MSTVFIMPQPWEMPRDASTLDIWRPNVNLRKLPLPNKEALVVSAILFLDSLTIGSTRLLSKAFPENALRPRYPPLYLDYEFLSTVGKARGAAFAAVQVLQELVATVPPTLLRDLAHSLLKTLNELPTTSTKYPELQNATFEVIALLPLSDRP